MTLTKEAAEVFQQVAETEHEPDDLGDPRGKTMRARLSCPPRRWSDDRELSAVTYPATDPTARAEAVTGAIRPPDSFFPGRAGFLRHARPHWHLASLNFNSARLWA
jgi:hypothetical protein